MVQREMNYNGLQLPESRGSQIGSRRKPYIFIPGSERVDRPFTVLNAL